MSWTPAATVEFLANEVPGVDTVKFADLVLYTRRTEDRAGRVRATWTDADDNAQSMEWPGTVTYRQIAEDIGAVA